VSGLSFRDIIEKLEGSEKETLSNLYDELSSKTTELKDSIAASKRYIELHLNLVTTMLDKIESGKTTGDNNATYDKSGDKEETPQEPPKRFVPTKA